MNENKESKNSIDDHLNPELSIHLENRQEGDRRSESSKGFTYISTVGWIDRRERRRRRDDPLNY